MMTVCGTGWSVEFDGVSHFLACRAATACHAITSSFDHVVEENTEKHTERLLNPNIDTFLSDFPSKLWVNSYKTMNHVLYSQSNFSNSNNLHPLTPTISKTGGDRRKEETWTISYFFLIGRSWWNTLIGGVRTYTTFLNPIRITTHREKAIDLQDQPVDSNCLHRQKGLGRYW